MGSEESIANRLKKNLAELKKEADAITTVGSLQIQYLVLRWCFCQKIIHLQRTIPPNLIGTYLEPGFTDLKKLILNSILGRANGIPPKTFALAELHIQDSGLGLFHSANTSKAAYLASFVECVSVLASDVSLEEPELTTGMVYEASRCLEFFHSLDPTITHDSLTKMVTKTAESRITPQHHLDQTLRGEQRVS